MIIYRQSTKSTQDLARNTILKNIVTTNNNRIFISEKQTNGRGRYGKKWISKSGNLYCSIIFDQNQIIHQKILSLIIPIAITEILEIRNIAKYKWPNDIMIKGKKIGGILIENINLYNIVGIGINLLNSPKVSENYETDNLYNLDLLKFDITKDNLISLCLKFLEKIIFYNNKSSNEIIKIWTQNAFKINEIISIGEKTGKFIGLTKNGSAVLKINDKTEIITSVY